MTLKEILEMLDIVEKKKTKGLRDEMRISMLRLVFFGDGSGMVDADWSKYRKDMCGEEVLLRQIFSVESAIFEFSKIEELEEWLKREA